MPAMALSASTVARPGRLLALAPGALHRASPLQRLTLALPAPGFAHHLQRGAALRVRAAAQQDGDVGAAGKAAIALGLVANPIVLWSAYTLKTTGGGLPPGPGGILGAAEGVSYLVVLGTVAWSLATKARTGSGLPAGPAGLLGAVEGFSYLALLASIAVFGLELAQKGSLPGPLG